MITAEGRRRIVSVKTCSASSLIINRLAPLCAANALPISFESAGSLQSAINVSVRFIANDSPGLFTSAFRCQRRGIGRHGYGPRRKRNTQCKGGTDADSDRAHIRPVYTCPNPSVGDGNI